MNRDLAIQVIEELLAAGVEEFVICPSSRNAPLANLITTSALKHWIWYEERSSAFFALGRARLTGRPVAISTTSGTACGELLPAMMEAYYASVPLVALTADRPRCYRGCNAPQAAEQINLFGIYTPFQKDVEGEERLSLTGWCGRKPAHINVCFDQAAKSEVPYAFKSEKIPFNPKLPKGDPAPLNQFLEKVKEPLVIVSTLPESDQESVVQFLLKLGAPVYLEGISGLRNDPRLSALRVYNPQLRFHDAVLRIGGVPTIRIWRDLDNLKGKIEVYSITEHPFSGLYWGDYQWASISSLLNQSTVPEGKFIRSPTFFEFQNDYQRGLEQLFDEEPLAEASLIHQLSKHIPKSSLVYLGNSLPIREWDLAATYSPLDFDVQASRGLNGIDGQVSCFFGLCKPERHNAAIIGDLTTLYDLAAPWCVSTLQAPFTLFVINNGGGKIFSRMFTNEAIQNLHSYRLESFANLWNLPYQAWEKIPSNTLQEGVVEVFPDSSATQRFWQKFDLIKNREMVLV